MPRVRHILVLAALASAAAPAQEDPIARLGRGIETGAVKVRFDEEKGYLPWLLQTLRIPPESQMLVFSKTGVQGIHTGPATPRHIYFNDSTIVATVKGGPVEILAQDPARGIVFYLLDQTPFRYREFLARPKPVSPFARRTDCLTCHVSKETGVAGTLIRSVTTDLYGVPLERFPVLNTDYRTPFDKLWGGWFVTGRTEGRHSGNLAIAPDGRSVSLTPPESSDIAALMVFEHQTRAMNLIARLAAAPTTNGIADLAATLVFEGEAPLPAPVESTSGFAAVFSDRGARDAKRRSLRDLDLQTRLMRYPASYMVYAEAFQALAPAVKSAVYRRMEELLAIRPAADRKAAREILGGTLAGFRDRPN